MPQSSHTFRIFVSSTFRDLKAERNALQQYVFPRLRDLAAAHGCRFQAIDLRWGVSEEAGLDQQTMNICLTEIERCRKVTPRPNFIILLGDRYGWRPLPESIPADEFERLLPLAPAREREKLGAFEKYVAVAPPEYEPVVARARAQIQELQSYAKRLPESAPSVPARLSYPDHYRKESAQVGGTPHRVKLEQIEADPFGVSLVYRWYEELSPAEADKLDSRLRAFIACAVYDAAQAARLTCLGGPPYGRRPSWNLAGRPVPFSLQEAGFDVDQKACWLRVGPIGMAGGMMQLNRSNGVDPVLTMLAEGYRQCFAELTV